MSHEQKQKLKDYRKEYYKKYYAEKKLNNRKQFIYLVIIKEYNKSNLLLNKTREIVYFIAS